MYDQNSKLYVGGGLFITPQKIDGRKASAYSNDELNNMVLSDRIVISNQLTQQELLARVPEVKGFYIIYLIKYPLSIRNNITKEIVIKAMKEQQPKIELQNMVLDKMEKTCNS